jgi:hypothetical protein
MALRSPSLVLLSPPAGVVLAIGGCGVGKRCEVVAAKMMHRGSLG